MKILSPALREKKRYIVFELISEKTINRKDLIYEIFSCANSLIGDVGASECNIRLLIFEQSKGIIRCAHNKIDETRSILATITSINDERCLIHIIGISGTLLSAKNKHLYKLSKFSRKKSIIYF